MRSSLCACDLVRRPTSASDDDLTVDWRSVASTAETVKVFVVPATNARKSPRFSSKGAVTFNNSALYMVAVTRLRQDPSTRAYMERRLVEGETKRDVDRSLADRPILGSLLR